MFRKTIIATTLVVLVASAVPAAEPARWLNVQVKAAEDNANVDVRVPLSLVLTVLDAVKTDEIDAGKISLHTNDADIDWPKLLQAIKDAPDAKFVTVKSDDANVEVEKRAGTILINVVAKDKDNAHVQVQVPAALLDAVLIDDNDRLDLKSLLAGLDSTVVGDLVKVTAPEANVRVWIE